MTSEEIATNNEQARLTAQEFIRGAITSVREFVGSNQVAAIVERLQQLQDEIGRM